jgi:hypothetical protein
VETPRVRRHERHRGPARAVFKLFDQYDWAGSGAEFRRGFVLSPNCAFAHDQSGLGLAFQGRLEESIAASRRAAELDPHPCWCRSPRVSGARVSPRRRYFPIFASSTSISSITRFAFRIVSSKGSSLVMSTPACRSSSIG